MVKGEIADPDKIKLPELPADIDEEPEEPEDSDLVVEEPAEEKPKPGDMMNFTKEVDYGVIDEDGERIPCSSLAESKILSLLLELKGGK